MTDDRFDPDEPFDADTFGGDDDPSEDAADRAVEVADDTDDPGEGSSRRFEKRDRLARMLRVVAVLRGHPDGIRPSDIARRVGVATRTIYRDLRAL